MRAESCYWAVACMVGCSSLSGGEASSTQASQGDDTDSVLEGHFTSPQPPAQGGAAHSSEEDGGVLSGRGPAPAVQQWFACQCGGPCEGAEAPLLNPRPSCYPQRGSTVGDQYDPCEGLFCGLPCALSDPGPDQDPQAPSSLLCSAEGKCVPAEQAVCL